MPTIGGQYIPLTGYQRQLAEQYIGNIIRGGKVQRAEAVDKAISKLGLDKTDRNSIIYEYGRAKDANDAAAIVRGTHNRTPLPSEIPTIRGDSRHQGQYRSELLVTITDPSGNVVGTTRSNYYSNSPISLQSIRRDIANDPTAFVANIVTPTGQRNAQPSNTVSVTVISVGRINNA